MDTTTRSMAPTNSGNTGDSSITKATNSAHTVVDSVAHAADEAASRAKPAIDRVAAIAHQAVDKAAGAAAPTADWIVEHGESLKATQQQMLSNTCSYVSANPMKSLSFAVLAGILLGRVLLK